MFSLAYALHCLVQTPMLARGHALKIANLVVLLVFVPMMHMELGRQIQLVTKPDQVSRLRVIFPKPIFHVQPMREYVPYRSEWVRRASGVQVAVRMLDYATIPHAVVLAGCPVRNRDSVFRCRMLACVTAILPATGVASRQLERFATVDALKGYATLYCLAAPLVRTLF
jgi:hypothetical protein